MRSEGEHFLYFILHPSSFILLKKHTSDGGGLSEVLLDFVPKALALLKRSGKSSQ
jgi:hypothetical protein